MEKDELIDFKYSIEASENLKKLGFEIDIRLSDDLAHGIDEQGLEWGLNFIKKHLMFKFVIKEQYIYYRKLLCL